jgi:hypothetical protein
MLERRMADALANSTDLAAYDRSIVEVVRLSVEKAKSIESSAGPLLNLPALLNADSVGVECLACIPNASPLGNEMVRANALRTLQRFSLVHRLDAESPSYSVHRVVQAVARDVLGAMSEDTVVTAVDMLAHAALRDDFRTGLGPTGVFPHVQALLPIASVVVPKRAEALLTILAHIRSFRDEHIASWAGDKLLTMVEGRSDATDDDLINALATAHRSHGPRSRSGEGLAELYRAVQLSTKTHGQSSEKTGELRIELARHLARQYEWFVEDGQDDDDLKMADEVVTTALLHSGPNLTSRATASAHVLRAGIRAHLGRIGEALDEYSSAVQSQEEETPWLLRRPAAKVLIKMGRCHDARLMITPLADVRAGIDTRRADPYVIRNDDIDRVYEYCLYEQCDWKP